MKIGKILNKFLTNTRIGRDITKKIMPDSFSGMLRKKIASKEVKVIKVSVFDMYDTPAVQAERNTLSEFITSMEAQGKVTTTKPYSKGGKAPFTEELNKIYDDILEEYRTLKPAQKRGNPYTETRTNTFEQINGETTILEQDLSGEMVYEDYPYTEATLVSNGKKLKLWNLEKFDPKLSGDEHLTNEFNTFLEGRRPSLELFQEFVRGRNIAYIKENGLYDLKGIRKSVSAGKEVERQTEQYRSQRQHQYERLFRPYHTEQFYRVIGMDELTKLLRGETIISKNSQARYGRKCVDITTNGYYHDIFYGETKFRIEFKRVKANGSGNYKFGSKICDFREEKNHYQVPSYNYQDVELGRIKYWDGSDWKPLHIEAGKDGIRIST